MSLLHRIAITINRKQPYIDWANGFDDDGPKLTADVGHRDSIYLVPVGDEATIEDLLAEGAGDGLATRIRGPKAFRSIAGVCWRNAKGAPCRCSSRRTAW